MQAARGATLTPEATPHETSEATPGPRPRRLAIFGVAAVVAYALDVVTKVYAVANFSPLDPVTAIPGVLELTLYRNPGAAFGMATGMTVVLSVFALVVCVVVVRLAGQLRDPVWALALGLLLGGALGNLTDRLLREPGPLRGHVIDFLQLPNWPIFNLADSAIVVAGALIVLQALRGVAPDGTRDDDPDLPDDPDESTDGASEGTGDGPGVGGTDGAGDSGTVTDPDGPRETVTDDPSGRRGEA